MKTTILFFALVMVSVVTNAQNTTKTLVKTLPQNDTIDISRIIDEVEIIETLEDFAKIQVEVTVDASEEITNKLANAGAFGVNYQQNKTLNVAPRKKEFFITVGGRDLNIKRKYKLYVPEGIGVKR